MARPRKSEPASQSYVQSRLFLVLDLVWFLVLMWPCILLALYRKLIPSKCKSLDGKVVMVTGAGQGLGRELAVRFARLGCKVACVDINGDTVLDTVEEIVRDGERARAYFTNVAKVEEIRELRAAVTKDLGPVDILVNNASLVYAERQEDTPDQAVRAVVDVNFLSYIWMVREFLEPMKERNAGHIVTISSMSAHTSLVNASMYVACKWAITGFIESVRLEMKAEGYDNIHFTTIYPTFMDNVKSALSSRQRIFCYRLELVAARTILAIRRNVVNCCIPEYTYYLCIVSKLLPTRVADWGCSLFNGEGIVYTKLLTKKCDPVIRDTNK